MNTAPHRTRMRRIAPRTLLAGVLAVLAIGASALSASAHGFSSVVFADVTDGTEAGHVAVDLQLEYDLLAVSAADAEADDALFDDGTYAFELGDDETRAMVLDEHESAVLGYISDRFTVQAGGIVCTPSITDAITMTVQEDAPYAVIPLDYDCGAVTDAPVITSTLFADAEGYVTGTTTIATYDLGGHSGSAALDQKTTSFSTAQTLGERFVEFFLLGAEHLLFGIDHILFLLALIAGSRRLREIVLAATAFTVAHSITFIVAAIGLVSVPASIIEPIIAISISIVAAWYLFRLATDRKDIDTLEKTAGPLGLDRAGWIRLGVVFVFGLVHGLGFASALGIDEPWSWELLWSLLIFNVGIEAVQIGIIVVVFPLLVLLRRKWPRIGMWVTGLLAATVAVIGLIWFVERLFGA